MAFTDQQRQALKAKLRIRHVKTRVSHGTPIRYVEGWHAIAEANRIFGYDSWDRQTLAPRCLWRESQRGETACFYATKVRITVRAGDSIIMREGNGTGLGRASSPELAHEIALKAAETDATKRALATFGNPFGLALYDKDQKGVTKRPRRAASAEQGSAPYTLRHEGSAPKSFDMVEPFVAAVIKVVRTLPSIEAVYAFWQANLDSFAALPRTPSTGDKDPVHVIGSVLKSQARALAQRRRPQADAGNGSDPKEAGAPARLAIPKDKRLRDKAHLAFVASQPCLVCGRRPAQAHHLRFAQQRALGLKVSDEFTVPLCNGHHDSLHHTGDERAWWARHGILDPLKMAARLWAASHQRSVGHEQDATLPLSLPADAGVEPTQSHRGTTAAPSDAGTART
jgi:hypothetical protein